MSQGKEQIARVVVDKQGNVSMETQGFQGSSCASAAEFLSQALGEVKTTQKTAEYYNGQKDVAQVVAQ